MYCFFGGEDKNIVSITGLICLGTNISRKTKGSPQTLSGQLFLKNHKLKTVRQQKGKK